MKNVISKIKMEVIESAMFYALKKLQRLIECKNWRRLLMRM